MSKINKNSIKDLIGKMDDIKITDSENSEASASSSLTFHYDKDLPKPSIERLQSLRQQVKALAKLPQPVQRSEQWYEMRKNMITASDWAAALGKNPYSYRNKLIRGKCGEQQSFYGGHMQHGVKYEPVANMIYEHRNNIKVIDFGLIPHPTINFLGASPDGITEDGVMLEIKCPPKRSITGEPPIYYWIQVQGQLEICELDRCDFLECKIIEYETVEICPETYEPEEYDEHDKDEELIILEPETQYFNDNYKGDHFYNEHGMEKGVVLVYMHRTTHTLSYEYSKLGIDREDFEKWKTDVNDRVLKDENMLYYETSFWKLTEVSNVPIYRDQEWFANNLPELRKFWDDVLHYREVGLDEIKPKPRKRRSPPKQIFVETSIEDFNGTSNINFTSENLSIAKFKTESFFTDTPLPRTTFVDHYSSDDDIDKFKGQSLFSDDTEIVEKKFVKIRIKKVAKPVSTQSLFSEL